MSLYLAFEWIVIVLLVGLSLRSVWRRVIKPALQKPKAGCGTGCNSCAPASKPV